MAGKLRYWKEKGGRFWARMAVPAPVRRIIGKSEIIEPLGGDRRAAIKAHPAAVARLQAQITAAEAQLEGIPAPEALMEQITTADFARAVWDRYNDALARDEERRAHLPGDAEIEAATERAVERVTQEGIDLEDPTTMLDVALDVQVLKEAASFDANARKVKLDALRDHLAQGEMALIAHEVDDYLDQNRLLVQRGSPDWASLARRMMRAEIEALHRTLERDRGDYTGQPTDQLVKPATEPEAPVSLTKLWADYVAGRKLLGYMKDGGKRQTPVIENLRKFLGHNDARRIATKDLIDWNDHLLLTCKLSAKTISDIYLSTVRSLFAWAHEKQRLPENVALTVKQKKPRKVYGRERGYTDKEAVTVLRTSRQHEPKPNQFGYVRETAHMTAAKRWVPIICAFTGARVSEITQLRREDLRKEGSRWVVRITPDAGSVKTSGFRDVPLHRQIINEGSIEFVKTVKAGPLFHGADDPARYATAAASVSDELAKWLRRSKVTPEGLQPNHAWRHRLKTQARNLGLDMRIVDCIQGHAPRTAGDNYGDVSLIAKARVIDALPTYDLAKK